MGCAYDLEDDDLPCDLDETLDCFDCPHYMEEENDG